MPQHAVASQHPDVFAELPARPAPHLVAVPPLDDANDSDPPHELLRALAVQGHEVIEGRRPLLQLSAWITRELAEHLTLQRTWREDRRRVFHDTRPHPVPCPGNVHVSRPRDGIAEATVLLRLNERTIAVAIRVEYLGNRWRATELAVLG